MKLQRTAGRAVVSTWVGLFLVAGGLTGGEGTGDGPGLAVALGPLQAHASLRDRIRKRRARRKRARASRRHRRALARTGKALPGGAPCLRDRQCRSGECGGIPRRCYFARGSLKAGRPCRRDRECTSRSCGGIPRVCRVTKGSLAAGKACRRNRDCASGQCSGVPPRRRCTARTGRLPAGARCQRNQECASGQCTGVGRKRTCTARTGTKRVGAGCRRNQECASGQCRRRRCVARKTGKLQPGQRCRRNRDCGSGRCSGVPRRCTARVGTLRDGASCKRSEECASGMCRGAGRKRTCVARTGSLPAGRHCKRDRECSSGECYRGRCLHRTGSQLPGDPCRRNKECRYSRCYYGVCKFHGGPCQQNQSKPEFPFRSSRSRQGVAIRWMGSAGFEISIDDKRIIIDPYMARPWKRLPHKVPLRGGFLAWTSVLKTLAWALSPLYKYGITDPRHLKYYWGIDRADWIFVTHGHVDHSAEYGGLLVRLAREHHRRGRRLKIGIIGTRNQQHLVEAYNRSFKLEKRLGATIDFRRVGYFEDTKFDKKGFNKWPAADPRRWIRTFHLGGGITTTWYPGHHSVGKSATHGWGRYGKPPVRPGMALPMHMWKADGIHNVLLEIPDPKDRRDGKIRILFVGSNQILNDPLPQGPVDVVFLAIAEWNTKNADKKLEFLRRVKPDVLIPTHYDDYFWEWKDGCFLMEYANLPLFLRKVPGYLKSYGLKTRIKVLDYGEEHRIR